MSEEYKPTGPGEQPFSEDGYPMPNTDSVDIIISYSDGQHTWLIADADDSNALTVRVPRSTVDLWIAARALNAQIEEQLKRLDNSLSDARAAQWAEYHARNKGS